MSDSDGCHVIWMGGHSYYRRPVVHFQSQRTSCLVEGNLGRAPVSSVANSVMLGESPSFLVLLLS